MTVDEIVAALESDPDLAAAVASRARVALDWELGGFTSWRRVDLVGRRVAGVIRGGDLYALTGKRRPDRRSEWYWKGPGSADAEPCMSEDQGKLLANRALRAAGYAVVNDPEDEVRALRAKVAAFEMAEAGPAGLESSLGLNPRCQHCGRRTEGGDACPRCVADDARVDGRLVEVP